MTEMKPEKWRNLTLNVMSISRTQLCENEAAPKLADEPTERSKCGLPLAVAASTLRTLAFSPATAVVDPGGVSTVTDELFAFSPKTLDASVGIESWSRSRSDSARLALRRRTFCFGESTMEEVDDRRPTLPLLGSWTSDTLAAVTMLGEAA